MRQSDVGEGGLAARRRRRARYDAGVETLADHGVHEPLALLVVTPLLFQDGLHFGKKRKFAFQNVCFVYASPPQCCSRLRVGSMRVAISQEDEISQPFSNQVKVEYNLNFHNQDL